MDAQQVLTFLNVKLQLWKVTKLLLFRENNTDENIYRWQTALDEVETMDDEGINIDSTIWWEKNNKNACLLEIALLLICSKRSYFPYWRKI